MAKNNRFVSNKNSRINSRIDRTGKLRTETVRRDRYEMDVAITTDQRSNSTRVFIDRFGRRNSYMAFELDGRQARTLFLALQKHFDQQGKLL